MGIQGRVAAFRYKQGWVLPVCKAGNSRVLGFKTPAHTRGKGSSVHTYSLPAWAVDVCGHTNAMGYAISQVAYTDSTLPRI